VKITVCELDNNPVGFQKNWKKLQRHLRKSHSNLLLLPELPFHPWIFRTKDFDPGMWKSLVSTHKAWIERIPELGVGTVLGTIPVDLNGKHLNQGFIWTREEGLKSLHGKAYLPNEDGFWEASWYQRAEVDFTPNRIGELFVGIMICTELWFFQHAREYGKKGVHLIVVPRATTLTSQDKWLTAGRVAAVVSGAYCISSNRYHLLDPKENDDALGWIIEPDGEVLGTTSRDHPFLTIDIDIEVSNRAKETYPRYVKE
jgi:N-carbamoylputrescine amidase